MPLTEEQRAKCRERYAERCSTDEAYREKVRRWALGRYYRKKERDAEAGVAPVRPVGRPRKYAIVVPGATAPAQS